MVPQNPRGISEKVKKARNFLKKCGDSQFFFSKNGFHTTTVGTGG
jgi:hypothetical protein